MVHLEIDKDTHRWLMKLKYEWGCSNLDQVFARMREKIADESSYLKRLFGL